MNSEERPTVGNAKTQPEPPEALTHAGGVVVRDEDGKVTTLLVRGSREPHDWVVPKGRIERGEAPDETAQREIEEEAGVHATPGHYLGDFDFTRGDGEWVHVGWYLMRFAREVPAQEDREIRWCTFAEARQLVRFDAMREILGAAEQKAGS
jgi:8-oxo-dGTP pyrophosphatase MutT (NUDIX family)